jgi:hypothetical protein
MTITGTLLLQPREDDPIEDYFDNFIGVELMIEVGSNNEHRERVID